MESIIGFTAPLKIAAAIAERSPDGNLAPPDVEALIAATSEAQGKVAITAMLLGYEQSWFARKDKAPQKAN